MRRHRRYAINPVPDELLARAISLAYERAPAWHARAACRDHPNLSWFIAPGEGGAEQKAICQTCPVFAECALAGASASDGIWAGLSARARRMPRKRAGWRVEPVSA